MIAFSTMNYAEHQQLVPFISGRALAFKDLSNFFQHMIFATISIMESKVVKFVKSKGF